MSRLTTRAAAFFLCAVAASAQPAAHAVFRTTDRGRTWLRSDRGLPGDSRINAFGSVGERVFAGTDSGIFVSDDAGKSWRASVSQPAPKRVLAFATLGQDLYAGSAKEGLFVSADQGRSWTPIAAFSPRTVRSLLVQATRMYAGTDADGVLVSSNNGRSWTALRDGLPPHAQVFAMATLGGRLFAALYAKGLYVWSEPERRWTRAGLVTPLVLAADSGALIAGHNPGGLHYSDSPDAAWSRAASSLDLTDDAPVWQLASGDGIAFAGAATGIYYSEDKGRHWTRARHGLPASSPGVAFHAGQGFVLAATLIKP